MVTSSSSLLNLPVSWANKCWILSSFLTIFVESIVTFSQTACQNTSKVEFFFWNLEDQNRGFINVLGSVYTLIKQFMLTIVKLASNFLLMVSLTIVNSMSSFRLYDQNQTENNKKKSQASMKTTIKPQCLNQSLKQQGKPGKQVKFNLMV